MIFNFVLTMICFSHIIPAHSAGSVSFAACGDILPDRGIRKMMETHGTSYPVARIAPLLQTFEVVFGNLESPLSERGTKADGPIIFRGDPLFAGVLSRAGFTVLSLANNHSLDYGPIALADTVYTLQTNNVVPIGVGCTKECASRPFIQEKNGVHIAYFASFPEGKYAANHGVMTINNQPTYNIASQIQEVKKTVDIVVVSLHWGREYTPRPTPTQKDEARTLVEAGADLVLGHHPHLIQGIERYGTGYIVYSLGNFIFDGWRPEERDSFLFACTLSAVGVHEPYLIPLVIKNGQPQIAQGEDLSRITDTLISLSRELGTQIVLRKNRLLLQ